MSVTTEDMWPVTAEQPDALPLSSAEKSRIIEVMNHHRGERPATWPTPPVGPEFTLPSPSR